MVLAAWWPVGSYWQSDDFLAITQGQSAAEGLADWFRPQYGMQSLVLFLRPMITLSFVIDACFGAWAPFVSHLGNVVAHGLSAVCLALIVCRFASARHAWATGLVWGLAPSHAGSVWWAVGRVDSHTSLWIVLATLFLVQWIRGERPSRGAALVCTALALASKELAGVLPGIAAVLCFATAAPGRRWTAALRGSAPFFAVLAGYLAWRYLAIGQLVGGYEGKVDWGAALVGLVTRVAQLTNPLLQGPGGVAGAAPLAWLGFAPAAVAVLALAHHRRFGTLALVAALFIGCALPSVQVWSDTANPMILRQFYLPMMPLAVLLASCGWRTALPMLVLAIAPFVEIRTDYQESWRRCADWHRQIQATVPGSEQSLNFIEGLPRQHPDGTAVELHLFVDRLLQPPFAASDRRLLALRPMSQSPTAHRLPYGSAAAVPFGATFRGDAGGLAALPRPATVQPMTCTWHGPAHLDLAVLDQMVKNFQDPTNARPELDPYITVRGIRSPRFRVTVFTATGYVTTFVPDSAAAAAPDGRVHVGSILNGAIDRDHRQFSGDLLQIATAIDLHRRLPLLIEADTRPGATGDPASFTATHANGGPLWLDLDRRFARWWP